MWFIVRTENHKEEHAKQLLLSLNGVQDVYLPKSFRKVTGEDGQIKRSYAPTITGILFVNIDEEQVDRQELPADARKKGGMDGWNSMKRIKQVLKQILTPWGYFCWKDENGKMQFSTAHLLCPNVKDANIESIIVHSCVSDEDVERFRYYNERLEDVEDVTIVDESYAELEATKDTVCIMEGPYLGFQGIIKRTYVESKKRDRCLYLKMHNLCIRIPKISQYRSIVIREHTEGEDAEKINAWRHIDRLIGSLQASGYPDDASQRLQTLITSFSNSSKAKFTIEYYRQFVGQVGTLIVDGKLRGTMKGYSYEELNKLKDFRKECGLGLLDDYILQMSVDDESSLINLCNFFRKCANTADAVKDIVPDTPLRPFLTPTPGKALDQGKDYTILQHTAFIEVIVRTDLRPHFAIPVLPKFDKQEPKNEDDIYYAHVGLFPREDGKVTAIVNWSSFYHAYDIQSKDEHCKFEQSLERNGYTKTSALLFPKAGTTPIAFSALEGYETGSNMIAGFNTTIATQDAKSLLASDPMQDEETAKAVRQLITACAPAAVELWQSPRLLACRSHTQRSVLLHK